MGMSKDGYKLKREAYMAEVRMHHELLCNFFGKPVEPIAVVHERLRQNLKKHEVDQMAQEIAELIEEGM
jgi:hypothetical protein